MLRDVETLVYVVVIILSVGWFVSEQTFEPVIVLVSTILLFFARREYVKNQRKERKTPDRIDEKNLKPYDNNTFTYNPKEKGNLMTEDYIVDYISKLTMDSREDDDISFTDNSKNK